MAVVEDSVAAGAGAGCLASGTDEAGLPECSVSAAPDVCVVDESWCKSALPGAGDDEAATCGAYLSGE